MKNEVVEIPKKDGKLLVKRDERGRVVKGSVLNPTGKPIGLKNFETDFDDAVKEIAEEKGITIGEARNILFKKAYTEAEKGNFLYYRDIIDRLYGKVVEKTETKSANLNYNINADAKDLNKYDNIKDKYEEELNNALLE